MLPNRQEHPSGKTSYHRFAHFLNTSSGIVLGENKEYLVRCRLSKIIQDEGFEDLDQLVLKLEQRTTPRTLKEKVIDAMTTNETFWFRDVHPFEALKKHILPTISENIRALDPVHIWSAACSSGQEPYTISMTVEEFLEEGGRLPSGVQISATDISTSMLEHAKKAQYDELSLSRGLSLQRRDKFFEPGTDKDKMQVIKKITARVQFRNLNLLDTFTFSQKFHCIFCRNVLIYFSPEIKAKILEKMYTALHPGGYIVLGGTESIGHQNHNFEMLRVAGAIIYKRKDH